MLDSPGFPGLALTVLVGIAAGCQASATMGPDAGLGDGTDPSTEDTAEDSSDDLVEVEAFVEEDDTHSTEGGEPLHLPGETYDDGAIPIVSAATRAFLGADSLPIRSRDFSPASSELPRLVARDFDDEEVRSRLDTLATRGFGEDAGFSIVEQDDTFVLTGLDEGRGGYCVKHNAGCHLFGLPVGPDDQPLENDRDAIVNAILDKLAARGLLELGPSESLDYLSRTTSSDSSRYSVSFGRRVGGVPVLEDQFFAVIHSDGRLSKIISWVELAATTEPKIALGDDALLNERRQPELMSYPPQSMTCGYVFDGTLAPQALGVGCEVIYGPRPDEDSGVLGAREWINLSLDGTPTLGMYEGSFGLEVEVN